MKLKFLMDHDSKTKHYSAGDVVDLDEAEALDLLGDVAVRYEVAPVVAVPAPVVVPEVVQTPAPEVTETKKAKKK